MRKILAFLLSLIIAYTPALLFAADIDFNNRYQKSSWKIDTSKGVNPYNTAGSGQTDYLNTSKYNVQAQRQVTKNGTSSTQKASVTVTTSKEELKTTIANRAKNLSKYTKGLGKATVGGFLGSAALTGLIEGIGWIIDEGGNVTKLPDPNSEEELKYTSQYRYYISAYNVYVYTTTDIARVSHQRLAQTHSSYYGTSFLSVNYVDTDGTNYYVNYTYSKNGGTGTWGAGASRASNPYYNPNHVPVSSEVTPEQIETALKNALESNNPALAAAIAQAVKDAFVESPLDTDPDTKEKIAPLPKKTTDALNAVADPQLEPEDTSVPLPPEGTPDNSVIEKPEIGQDGSLPDSCDWFNFLCKWTEWTKEEPDLDKDTKLEIEEKEFDSSIFSKTRFGVPDQCPAPVEHTLEVTGISTSFSFDLSPLCDVLSFAKPALIACSYLYAAYIVIGAARNG